jgi:uncharacterized protein
LGAIVFMSAVSMSGISACSTERTVVADPASTSAIDVAQSTTRVAAVAPVADSAELPDSAPLRLVAAARSQVGVTVSYDGTYRRLDFPGGDVDPSTGVCTDVAIRALRKLDIDLQQRVNSDMRASFNAYPKKWGLTKPDPNIDHRRVPNLETYFSRRGYALPVTTNPNDYLPGDIVTMKLPLDHLGIVSDRTSEEGIPLVIHNVGSGTKEENVLFAWKLVGHFRVVK